VIEKIGLLKVLKKIPSLFSRAYLLIVVFFGWILFRFSNFEFIPVVLKGMFMQNGNKFYDYETEILFMSNIFFIIVAIISVTPLMKIIVEKLKPKKRRVWYVAYNFIAMLLPIVFLLLSTLALVGDSYNPFLYFQF
jgi:alginate O-acetyltransferase complex protein AlgI